MPESFEGPPIRPPRVLPGRGTGNADLGGGIGTRQMTVVEAGGPMRPDPLPVCDLDRNGTCDASDRATLAAALGVCRRDPDYHPAYDADGDGCVTLADRDALFR